jgi:hypothetical protein
MRLLASLFGQVARLEEDATEHHATDARLAELAMSHGDLANLLRTALKAQHPGPDIYCWVRDVFDAEVVYELSNKDDVSRLYRRSYAVDDAGAVTLGEPVSVVAVTSYVAATESGDPVAESADLVGDLVPLTEKAVAKDGGLKIKLIQAGQGSSGYYPAETLKRDGPKVFTSGLHMHLDHPSVSEEADRPERSVTTLAGTLTSDARWEEQGPAGPGLYADAKVRSDLAPLIEELAPHIGVSIRALGKAGTSEIGGKRVRTIEGITQAKSVDFVTVPGAGGKVLDLVESARQRHTGGGTPPPEDDGMEEKLNEANAKIADLETRLNEAERREREARLLQEARTLVVAKLAEAALPQPSRDRLVGQLAANPPTKDGALDADALATAVKEAADAEAAYLASVTGTAYRVTGMGGGPADPPAVPTLEESDKRIAEALKFL